MKHWRLVYLSIPLTIIVFAGIMAHNDAKAGAESIPLPAKITGTAQYDVPAVAEPETEEEETSAVMRVYIEGDGPAPEWWTPDEEMAAVWIADVTDTNVGDKSAKDTDVPVKVDCAESQRKDAGCPDWNVDAAVTGWDGHTAEPWELDLLARVFYLEFWGVSDPCAEAGCDAILNLWDTGRYGRTLFEALSYYDPQYGYTYRVYPWVWETKYDPDGLAWCKEFCTGRFINGPEWSAVYFQLGGYHDTDWVPPLYEMDGVYFSGKGWQ